MGERHSQELNNGKEFANSKSPMNHTIVWGLKNINGIIETKNILFS
jgi:hypothetical protein